MIDWNARYGTPAWYKWFTDECRRLFAALVADLDDFCQDCIVRLLMEKLPNFSHLHQNLHYEIDNWQPFYWRNFSQTTYYSFAIPDISDPDFVFRQFSERKRRDIKKAREKLEIRYDQSSEAFYNRYKFNLAKQGKKISYNYELFRRIYDAAYSKGLGRVFYAVDAQEQVHSAIFIVWDQRSAFYLVNSIDPDLRSSGATSLLTWTAIQSLHEATTAFDFEGSMVLSVADSYRAFGANARPYSHVWKTNSSAISLGLSCKGALRKKKLES